ncbi:hypothetical protein FRC10_004960, partial [Ceratobasidium sp. 414]
YSMLPALTLDGILTLQVIVGGGGVTAELFHEFIEQLLSNMRPFPAPRSVIFMDNCLIYKWQATLDMITERFVEHIRFAPERHWSSEDRREWIYDEMWSAEWWRRIKGAMIAPIILAADKTQMTVLS